MESISPGWSQNPFLFRGEGKKHTRQQATEVANGGLKERDCRVVVTDTKVNSRDVLKDLQDDILVAHDEGRAERINGTGTPTVSVFHPSVQGSVSPS